MPTVTIKAFGPKALPSPFQLRSWREDWQQQAPAGNWAAFVVNGAQATETVTGLSVFQVDTTINQTLEQYNQTHTGNDSITWSVT